MMRRLNFKIAVACFTLGLLALSGLVSTEVRAQASAVNPAAVQILKRMTDYVSNLKQFSLHTQSTLEEVLDSGHRIDLDVSANVTLSRPNKLRAERRGDLVDQVFYYDGKTLTLYNPHDKVYATKPAPGTIEELLDFAREDLGLIIPVADLVYRNAFQLLMQDVDHLLFSRPGVDFQVWVADGDRPLPMKYVVTDRGNPGWVSVTTISSDWNVAPAVADARFTFIPPQGARSITFMPLIKGSGSSR
jgi:hypothetical protein